MSSTPASLPLDVWLVSKIWKAAMYFTLSEDGSFNRRLADLLDRRVSASEKPLNGIITKDVMIDKDSDLWVRVFHASGSVTRMPVIFHIHGGFFAFLTPANSNYDRLCRKLSEECNAVVVSVNYRRIPEHRYPSAIEDCFTAMKWVQSTTYQHLPSAADFSNSFLVGDSAGGNLAHFVACKAAAAGDLSPIVLRGLILVQPSFGGVEPTEAEIRLADAPFSHPRLSDWRWKSYLPEGADKDHPASNVCGPHATDVSSLSLPPALLIIGGYCTGQDRQRRYAEWMKAAGKQVDIKLYPHAVHGFYLFPKYELAHECLLDASEFIKSHCV